MSTSLIDRLNDVVPGNSYLITGDKINLYNAILRAVWAGHNLNTLNTGIRKKQNGGAGVSLFMDAVVADTAVVDIAPFQIISAIPKIGAMMLNITLQPGIINGNIFPTIGGNPMWVMVATTIDGVTTYAWPTITVNWGDTLYLQGTVSGGVITNVTINSSASPPAESDTLTTYYIATCDMHTGQITQLSKGNLSYVAQAAYFNAGSRLIYHLWTIVDNTL